MDDLRFDAGVAEDGHEGVVVGRRKAAQEQDVSVRRGAQDNVSERRRASGWRSGSTTTSGSRKIGFTVSARSGAGYRRNPAWICPSRSIWSCSLSPTSWKTRSMLGWRLGNTGSSRGKTLSSADAMCPMISWPTSPRAAAARHLRWRAPPGPGSAAPRRGGRGPASVSSNAPVRPKEEGCRRGPAPGGGSAG